MNSKSKLTDEIFRHATKHDPTNVQDARTCHITVFQSMRITLLLENITAEDFNFQNIFSSSIDIPIRIRPQEKL
jgi:hypothetical protein